MTNERIDTAAEIPIACTLSEAEMAARRAGLIARLGEGVEEVSELPDGYELRFAGSGEWVARLAAFIAGERDCCAFLAFELRFEPQHGPLRLRITGPEGAKAFLSGFLATAPAP